MRALAFVFFMLMAASGAMAASDEKPAPAVCKADLKTWSEQNTETLTIDQINTRMNEMVACAAEAHQHRHSHNKVRAYLDEFYRTRTELANRAFEFIKSHDLGAKFYEEKNEVNAEIAVNRAERKTLNK